MKERSPIFFDAERRRWRRTRLVLEISGVVLTLLLAYFFFNMLISVELPGTLLPDLRPTYHAVPARPRAHPVTVRSAPKARLARIGKVPETYDPTRAAFYVSWDPTSLASLKHHYKDLDVLMPEQLHAVTSDGALTVVDYEKGQRKLQVTPQSAVAILETDKLHRWLNAIRTANEKGLPAMRGLVNNYDGTTWRIQELAEALASSPARKRLADGLVDFALLAHEEGIVVDFEEVPESSQKHFREFAAELGKRMRAKGLKLSIALPARDEIYDYAYFAAQCDSIIVMNYDQHWQTSPPGPIAAQDWFVENINQLVRQVPPSKVIMGIANYAYDWHESSKKPREPAESMSVQDALLRAKESEAQVEFDSDSLNPHYSYYDEHNVVHQVWLLDAVTAYNELRASERAGVQGTALWRLGWTDSSLWPIWDTLHPDDATRAKIEDVPPGPDLILEGDGDIWRIADTPKNGRRTFQYDPASNLIVQENYTALPLSWDIDQLGAVPKEIALSFDDGPDPRWTPRILDVLRNKKAPATFFVIGEEANRFTSLLRREYAEGHEIGNHTYTHQRFDNMPHGALRIELNLTQRFFESALGVKSILFRPPYGIDHQPEYAEEIEDLPIPQEMGYILIGARIDPHDWQQTPGLQVTASEIVAGVLEQAAKGNIVLLHDGGGDRANTVAALPQIIDELRNHGYQLVLVSDLIGKTRADVMMPLSPNERLVARADGFIFGLYHWLRVGMGTVFLIGIILVSGRALVIGLLALVEKLRPDHAALSDPVPSVSILVPAYNEEHVILETVRAALASDYPDLRVIVVDDGSADLTGQILDRHFGSYPRVKIIHQENRGKSAALNRALAEATSDVVVTIDADTEVEPDAVRKFARHFSDPTVGAVAGNVKVGNRSRWLTRWQALEYITSQNLEKRAFDLLNCITVVPGALGAWRRDTVQALGGFTMDTVAEDADLTIAIRRSGFRIGYDEEAVAWTEAPETLSALIRQRFRWTFGTLQSVWKHRDTLFRPKHGTLGWIALPNVFIFQFFLPLISPVIDLMFLGSFLLWGLAQFKILLLPQLWTTADLERSLLFFLGFMLIDVLTCAVAFLLEKHEDWTLLVPVLLQRFYYRQMMYVVIFRSFMGAVQGRAVGWRGVEPDVPASVAHA